MQIELHVNGKAQVIEVDDPGTPLLYALRDDLGLSNPRFGCGLGQCGACTVHVDGRAATVCSASSPISIGRCEAGLSTSSMPTLTPSLRSISSSADGCVRSCASRASDPVSG